MDLNDLVNAAKADGLDVSKIQAGGGGFKPVAGETYIVKAIKARAGLNRNGNPSFSVHLEVTQGPEAGRRFWHNWYFTDQMTPEHHKQNALVAFLVAGVSGPVDAPEQVDLDPTGVEVEMTAKYGKGDYANHVFLPIAEEEYTTPDDDVEGFDWDD